MIEIKKLTKKTLIKDILKDVEITIKIDLDDIDFTYWDQDLALEVKPKLQKGLIQSYWVLVTAKFNDLETEGNDSLGEVLASSFNPEKEILGTVKEHGMIENSIGDLINQVLESETKLLKFFGKAA